MIAFEKPGKDPSLAANYRPVSLLSVCYKLLEHLALNSLDSKSVLIFVVKDNLSASSYKL